MVTKFRTVEEFLAALEPERRTEVDALREAARAAHPGLVESIKWNSPNFSLDGVDLLTVNVGRTGPARLVLHRGTETAEDKGASHDFDGDPSGLLTWHSNIRASVAMPADKRDEVVAVLRAWLTA